MTAESNMEDLIGRAMEQNFVPVIDDRDISSELSPEEILLVTVMTD